jgi:hypothetical protein
MIAVIPPLFDHRRAIMPQTPEDPLREGAGTLTEGHSPRLIHRIALQLRDMPPAASLPGASALTNVSQLVTHKLVSI